MLTCKPINPGSDPLGRYYTNNTVSQMLARQMDLKNPNLIVDLGTGDGSLSAEAARIWTDAKFLTVDIDSNVSVSGNEHFINVNRTHFKFDALNSDLHHKIGMDLESADGALCNPPYIQSLWRKGFSEILEDAGLSNAFPSIEDAGTDVLFIAQNLRLLRTSGQLGLILPDGIIAGQRHVGFRNTLFKNHKIEQIIELPRRIFRKTDAKAHILILTKGGSTDEFINVNRMREDGSLSQQLQVPIDKAIDRADYSYIEGQKKSTFTGYRKVNELYTTLTRGQLSSVQVRSSDINIFHSTNFPKISPNKRAKTPEKFILEKPPKPSLKTAIAKKGDILICRVGRNLEHKICYVHKGFVAISDCVYKLEVEKKYRIKMLNFLCSNEGKNQLRALTHGVGAKFLSKKDILSLMVKV